MNAYISSTFAEKPPNTFCFMLSGMLEDWHALRAALAISSGTLTLITYWPFSLVTVRFLAMIPAIF